MEIKLLSGLDVGGDALEVRAEVRETEGAEPVLIVARGWVSAIYNHFDPEHYEERPDLPGQMTRRDDAVPRRMTDVEVGEYCVRLVKEAFAASRRVEVQGGSVAQPVSFLASAVVARAG